jgi:hypothetical protein
MVMTQMKDDAMGSISVSHLIERKKAQFGDDHRLMGEFRVSLSNGVLPVRAEARDPYAMGKKKDPNQASGATSSVP